MPSEALRILEALVKARIALHENNNHDHRPHWVGVTCPSCGVDYRSVSAVDGETRFNPNHDPATGEFTSGSGGTQTTKFISPHEAYRELAKDRGGQLEWDEKQSLREYSGDNFGEIQKLLRNGKTDSQTDMIDRALDKCVLKSSVSVYRGISDIKKLGLSEDTLIGATIKDPAYMSATLDRHVAASFAGPKGIVVNIKIESGTKGLSMHNITQNEGEYEVLFPRNGILEITGKSKHGETDVCNARIRYE